METQSSVIQLLDAYQPENEQEQGALNLIREFVLGHARFWSRGTLEGHLTASAWITNTEKTQAVLLHHKKLNLWVQPGGHIDDEDPSLALASLREATEETGLTNLTLNHTGIFDLDVHEIPARPGEPQHQHLDIRFWFETDAQDLSQNSESNDLAWLTRSEIEMKTDEESVLRMARKTLLS